MKYNKSEILRKAWSLRKEFNLTMSTAMKAAWAEAKGAKKYFFNLAANRIAIAAYVVKLGAELAAGLDDIHAIHKYDILMDALNLVADANGFVLVDGKTVGLMKYAVRNAA